MGASNEGVLLDGFRLAVNEIEEVGRVVHFGGTKLLPARDGARFGEYGSRPLCKEGSRDKDGSRSNRKYDVI